MTKDELIIDILARFTPNIQNCMIQETQCSLFITLSSEISDYNLSFTFNLPVTKQSHFTT